MSDNTPSRNLADLAAEVPPLVVEARALLDVIGPRLRRLIDVGGEIAAAIPANDAAWESSRLAELENLVALLTGLTLDGLTVTDAHLLELELREGC